MHRLKKLYGDDSESFRPERWDPAVENAVDLRKIGWGYLPFNGGPRVCLGRMSLLLIFFTILAIEADLYARRIRSAGGRIRSRPDATEVQDLRTRPERGGNYCRGRAAGSHLGSWKYQRMSSQGIRVTLEDWSVAGLATAKFQVVSYRNHQFTLSDVSYRGSNE